MEIINDTAAARNEIEEAIRKNGFAPEHNYGYYQWLEEAGRENVFIRFPGRRGILSQYNSKINTWYFVSMPISEEKHRLRVITDAIGMLFEENNAKKVMLELTPDLKAQLADAFKNSKFRIGHNNYTYYWPVFDMKSWDGYTLKGKKWKKIRNIINRFYKENKVLVKDSRKIKAEKLKVIVHDWLRRRNSIDRPLYHRYMNMIGCNFDGADFARTLVVNNEPCSITCGWRIPNSKDYYSSVGIYNYKVQYIGEAANLDDLFFLKKKGFEKIDFGGSGKTLLQFKNKFRPSSIYKTYSFPVTKK